MSLTRTLVSFTLVVGFLVQSWSATASGFDVEENPLVFSNGSATRISGSGSLTGGSNPVGTAFLYSNVITVTQGGVDQRIDAIVTLAALQSANITQFDSLTNQFQEADYFQPNLNWTAVGGSATFRFSFIEGDSFDATTAPSGVPVTLLNVLVNSYDLDSSYSNGHGGKQYTDFTDFDGYTLSSDTALEFIGQSDNNGRFIPANPVNSNITDDPGTETGDKFRVRVSYQSLSEIEITVGDTTQRGTAYYGIDFSEGPNFQLELPATVYTVDATANPAEGGSASCSPSPVEAGEDSTCNATPSAGYEFTGWTGDCADEASTTCSLTNIQIDKASVANFSPITYTVVATANPPEGGTASCDSSPVSPGDDSTCSATPSAGYEFVGWTGDCANEISATCNLTNIQTNKTSVANFEELAVFAPSYSVVATANPPDGGSASCSPSPVEAGEDSTCTATPSSGYEFTGWTGDCANETSTTCPLTNIQTNKASVANFATAPPVPGSNGSPVTVPLLDTPARVLLALMLLLMGLSTLNRRAITL